MFAKGGKTSAEASHPELRPMETSGLLEVATAAGAQRKNSASASAMAASMREARVESDAPMTTSFFENPR